MFCLQPLVQARGIVGMCQEPTRMDLDCHVQLARQVVEIPASTDAEQADALRDAGDQVLRGWGLADQGNGIPAARGDGGFHFFHSFRISAASSFGSFLASRLMTVRASHQRERCIQYWDIGRPLTSPITSLLYLALLRMIAPSGVLAAIQRLASAPVRRYGT